MSTPANAPIHISVVLDRSGSMATIADDIVGGFNEYLAEQRQVEGRVRVTLAQFDSQDPFEVLINGVSLGEVTDLDRSSYRPRGSTPLFDAIGRMIAKIDADSSARSEVGALEEDQVMLIVTDGLENASREYSRQMIFDLIEARRSRGWVFVFLGANQDAFAEGHRMAFSQANSANWTASPEGSKEMWKDLSYSTSAHRAKSVARRKEEEAEFYKKRRRGN
jgi:Mg-chelatase subunit ChlD